MIQLLNIFFHAEILRQIVLLASSLVWRVIKLKFLHQLFAGFLVGIEDDATPIHSSAIATPSNLVCSFYTCGRPGFLERKVAKTTEGTGYLSKLYQIEGVVHAPADVEVRVKRAGGDITHCRDLGRSWRR
jgi:hypothetical protein